MIREIGDSDTQSSIWLHPITVFFFDEALGWVLCQRYYLVLVY